MFSASSKTIVMTPPMNVSLLNPDDFGHEVRLGRPQFRPAREGIVPPVNSHPPVALSPVDILLQEDGDVREDTTMTDIADAELPEYSQPNLAAQSAATSPIPISMSPSVSRSRSRIRDENEETAYCTPRASELAGRTRRKKKKAPKKAAASPALNTVRGFVPTPMPSGDDDSDFSPSRFKRRDLGVESIASLTGSPYLRPSSATGGISALRQQLDALALEPVPGQPSLIRNKTKLGSSTPSDTTGSSEIGSDTEPVEMIRYEVPLEHDFVSRAAEQADVGELPTDRIVDDVHRKMTAADFETLTCLGKGTFGTVHMVKQVATGRLFAQKQFRKASLTVHKRLIEQTKTERAILESINRHPFVVKLYYAFQDQEKLYLILEYAQGGELFTHLAAERMFPEDTAAFYMAEMILALEHLHHTVGVVYRDLKPENCLLDADGHLLLTDFGLSKVAVDGSDRCTSILGTVEYMAPEVILGHMYGTAVDWWSFGALGFDLLTGSPPFRANNHAKIQERILKQKLTLPYYLSADSRDLLTRLLRKEPSKRLGSNMPRDMATMKKHRFFRKIDWERLERRDLEPPIKPLITDPELAENFSSDFTSLALSPTKMYHDVPWGAAEESNPFGGFSYVASKSMLDYDGYF